LSEKEKITAIKTNRSGYMFNYFKQKPMKKLMPAIKKWFLRIGIIGFLFFLVKGLIWLAIFMGLGSVILK